MSIMNQFQKVATKRQYIALNPSTSDSVERNLQLSSEKLVLIMHVIKVNVLHNVQRLSAETLKHATALLHKISNVRIVEASSEN